MKKRRSKTSPTESRSLNERFKKLIVSRIEKHGIELDEAVQRYHVRNKSILIEWIRKYGIFDVDYIVVQPMKPSKDTSEVKKLKELLKAKDDEITRLKKEAHLNRQREIMVEAIIEVVREDYNIDLSKKAIPGLLKGTSSREEKEE
jgi:cell division protein FtsB